ncbi:MAG TPA: SDR family NAD(P)-dependent oxidoreductase [Anaerolineaceae bacterium]|nr:SDR family NAD(P)-dependent oxidoreductase [Anaerolineaceae bacterium]
MENGFFLITGTSRGIGEAIAKKILENANTVLGVSRNQSSSLKSSNYHHLSFDLNEISQISRIMEKADEIVGKRSFAFLCLVNNASASEPLGAIEKCPAEEIDSHVKIGLIAPMILTSQFIRRFSDTKTRKKVVFISSGAAFTPFSGDSIYCSAKAGIHMLAQCIGLEQKEKEYGFEVITIGPGMVDTHMQLVARSKTSEEYASADFMRRAFEQGLLQKPDAVAKKILTILENKYEQGQYVKESEI